MPFWVYIDVFYAYINELATILKSHITILDNYFNDGAKALSGIFMIWLFFGSLSLFQWPLFLKDLTIGILCLLGFLSLGTLLFSKKVLFMENGHVSQGLIFRDTIIFKKGIDLQNVKSINIYDNEGQLVIPWWVSMTGNLLTAEIAFKLKLENTSRKEKYLISFKSAESKNRAVAFFNNNTDLEIKNCG
ncbi:hypothetical protein GVT53_07895 [Flagellimonas oceani]|uniref:Uncharacterized protein n=2 Tax=Flagellimonas oceani TaxID=2698672 RepID=A0A6G7J164_9FLAO|nr:hypothetical protein [Allomuricauda oceani]QII44603.1 hypothetical protein GVT53_07895 [Allomuricauda oceani]